MPEAPGIFESELIQNCKNGDLKSQEKLYKHFYGYAMGVGLRYLPNREDALEVVNDAFMKVFKSLKHFEHDLPFKPWFRKIVVNSALDRRRKDTKFLNHIELEYAIEACKPAQAIENLTVQDILKLLNTLPEIQRMVFNLYEIDGYKHEEIGTMLCIPASSARVHLSRAKEKLKKAWLQEQESDGRTSRR